MADVLDAREADLLMPCSAHRRFQNSVPTDKSRQSVINEQPCGPQASPVTSGGWLVVRGSDSGCRTVPPAQ